MLECLHLTRKKDLAIQKEALRAYCQEHAVKVDQWVQDIGSALNYKRKGFNQAIEQIELGQVKQVVIVRNIWQKLSSVEREMMLIVKNYWQLFSRIFGGNLLIVTNIWQNPTYITKDELADKHCAPDA